jgi:limonene-1,2-epoxide hydrolase
VTHWFKSVATFVVACTLSACAATPVHTNHATQVQLEVVENYLAALNRRDLLVLTAYVAPDFEWLSMVNGERMMEVSGREELATALSQYFADNRDTRWSIQHANVIGDYLVVNERSEWRDGDMTQARNSLGIYELHDGRIRRVTYFLSGQ